MATPLFVSSLSTQRRHGVFAIEKKPPMTIVARGTGVVGMVAQFPWGPATMVQPTDIGDAIKTFAPPGFDHTGSAYLCLTGKAWPSLRLVRAVKSTSVAASLVLDDGATHVLTLTAKYAGAGGNSITATVADATDGDADHFDLTVSITGTSGTTTDVMKNVNFSGVGDDTVFNLTKSLLLASIVKTNAGRPDNGTFSFTSGTTAAIASAEYVGTAGLTDKGMALFEGDRSISHVCVDDCGNSLRVAVNAGLVAHAEFMGDRVVYINDDSGGLSSAARTKALANASKQAIYVDPWYYKLDDIDGTKRLVPPGVLAASVAANLSPSTSIAWKDLEVRRLLGEVVELEALRGDQAGSNTEGGVVTIIPEESGGFSFESAHTTSYPADASTGHLKRTLMAIYIVQAFTRAARPMTDAPNVGSNQDDLRNSLDIFLGGLKAAQKRDPNHTPHIANYSIGAANTVNSDDSVSSGEYYIPADVKTSSDMERIALSMSIGPTVKISASL